MARKTNETKAREACALHSVAVEYEAGNGVELWGRDTHTSTDKGTHSDYFPRENYRSDAAMWADVATVAATFKPCADDCECRAMTICGVCGNAGNVADFMETHICVSRSHLHNLTGDTINWVPCDTLTHCPSICDCPVEACTAAVVSPVSDSFPRVTPVDSGKSFARAWRQPSAQCAGNPLTTARATATWAIHTLRTTQQEVADMARKTNETKALADWERDLLAVPEAPAHAYPANSKCNDDNYVGSCLQCGSTFHAATASNIPAARAAMLICCETPIVAFEGM